MANYTNCLIDYIGLTGCTPVTPASGLTINGLPGISLKSIDQIADDEQVSFAGVWDDVQLRGTRKLMTHIKSDFSKRFKIKTIAQAVDVTRNIDTAETTVAAAKYRGFVVELDPADNLQGWVSSNFQSINFQTVSVYLQAAVNTTVKIFDLVNGDELFTSAVTGAIGWNTVQVNAKYTARKVFVCYDATLVLGTELKIYNESCGCDSWDCGARIRGGESDITSTVFTADVTKDNNAFGMTGLFNIGCSYDSLICNNKEVFADALWYTLGAELMLERLYTDRVNKYTTIDLKKAKELYELYTVIAFGGTLNNINYEGKLPVALDGISLNLEDCCIECNEQSKMISGHP